MCIRDSIPSNLKGKMVQDYVEFIKETGTKNFALNIDFSVFLSLIHIYQLCQRDADGCGGKEK